jgi:hypothetical protein
LGLSLAVLFATSLIGTDQRSLKLSSDQYEDRVRAAWTGQIIGTMLGFPFEGNVASSSRVTVNKFARNYQSAPVDDDYYYELVALRAFEKYGIDMTLDDLGAQWLENSAGSWGSSAETRKSLLAGRRGSEAGHPRHNRFWWTIGPQFSADIYGMIAPGDPNLAASLARKYCRINGYAEGTDGGLFVAGMVALAFRERDPGRIVSEAAQLIHPSSPYRRCLDMVIAMCKEGRPAPQIFSAVEDRWRIEYPRVNNAVANGGLVAASVWCGQGDFLKTVNLAFQAADFSDADCNAANAAAVVGAMRGMRALPEDLVARLNDRIAGDQMGPVKLTPRVDERISDVAARIAALGRKMLAANGAAVREKEITVPWRPLETQPAEQFTPNDLVRHWNPEWTLERAGFAGPDVKQGLRMTFLDGEALATWPRDPAGAVVLRRLLTLGRNPALEMEVAADKGCAWRLEVVVNNTKLHDAVIRGEGQDGEKVWRKVVIDLSAFAGQEVEIRLYQRTDLADATVANAYWRNLRIR